MPKKSGNWLWRLQRGNPVEWHDGHLKGTGKVVKPYHETTHVGLDGRFYKGSPDGFYVTDDAGTFKAKLFLVKQLYAIEKS